MLNRRFENTNPNLSMIPKSRVVMGFCIGIWVAILVYCFLSVFLEVFRVLQYGIGDRNGIIEFNTSEQYWINFLCASIALILGNSSFILFLLRRPQKLFSRYSTRRKRIISDQIFLSFSFIFWFSKVAFFVGIMVSVFIDFEFIRVFYYAFILLFAVLYLESWKALSQFIKNNRFMVQATHFIVLLFCAFLMSFYNPINHNKITTILNDINPAIALPVASYKESRNGLRSFEFKLFKRNEEYFVIDGKGSTGIPLKDFASYLEQNEFRKRYAEFSIVHLMADGDTPMRIIKELERYLMPYNYYGIQYITVSSDTKGIERYAKYGISRRISTPVYLNKNKFLPPLPVSFEEDQYEFIPIIIDSVCMIKGKKYVNGNELIEAFERYIDSSTVFRYEYSDNISYQNYIKILSAHKQAIFKMKKDEGLFLKEDGCYDNYVNDDQFNACYKKVQEEKKRLQKKYPCFIQDVIID